MIAAQMMEAAELTTPTISVRLRELVVFAFLIAMPILAATGARLGADLPKPMKPAIERQSNQVTPNSNAIEARGGIGKKPGQLIRLPPVSGRDTPLGSKPHQRSRHP